MATFISAANLIGGLCLGIGLVVGNIWLAVTGGFLCGAMILNAILTDVYFKDNNDPPVAKG
uniref:Uncharacterized protein n=1 Tax=viral metagenome TaxID=1070528 RepID=A0A6M3LNF3_9ZZZZ